MARIGWVEDGRPHGDEVVVIEDKPKLAGRFGIVLPRSRQVILFGKRPLWAKKQDAEFHLRHSRGCAAGSAGLHSAYVGELGKDFWLEE